jgi:hypothetical protein
VAQGVSDAWRGVLVGSPKLTFRAEVFDSSGQLVLTTDESAPPEQQIVVDDARVIEDATRQIRSTSDVVLMRGVDGGGSQWSLVPTTISALMSPLSGGTIQLYAGFTYPDDSEELVPISRHYWHRSVIDEDAAGLKISLSCQDLTGRLDACPLTAARPITAGTNVITAMTTLIRVVLPNVTIVATPTAQGSPAVVLDEQSNLLGELEKLAESIGYEMFMDPIGQLVIRPVPTIDDDPSWSYAGGQGLLAVHNALDDETTYNGVIAKGENASTGVAPVRGEVWDTDPTSPTYYDPANPTLSPIGPRPFFYVSEYLTSSSQCLTAARARLQKVKGLQQMVDINVVQNPALNVHDVLQIDRPTAGVGGNFMVERRSLVMGPSEQPIGCGQRRLLT